MEQLLSNFHPPNFPDSYFISFEGIEGAGKSTHIKKLKVELEVQGMRTIVLREPGGTVFGENLRTAILQSNCPLHPLTEAHLFASSRAQLLYEITLKELAIPKTVIIYDRYLDSSLAYQGHARGLGVQTILELHNHYPLTLIPHLTLYIKISLQTSYQRQQIRNKNKDYFESQNSNFYQKLIDGYELSSQLFPQRIVSINGEQEESMVYQEVKQKVWQLIFKEPARV